MKIQKLRDMNLGVVADELEELRAFKAEIESQEPFRWALDHLDFGIGTTLFDSEHGAIDFSRHLSCSSKAMPLYAKPVPPKQPSRITDEMISSAMSVVIGYSGEYGTYNEYLSKKTAREVLEAALSASEQELVVAVPDDHMHVSEFVDLCKSFSSRTGSIYIGDVEGALSGYLSAAKTFAPSHSQQSAQAWQPIETAPKDGTEILLCSAVIHDIGLCYWHEGMDGWTWGAGNYFRNPLHWMPLPEPPSLDRCPSQESKPDKEFNPRHNCATDCAVAAIEYALANDEPVTFLRLWMHGEFDALHKEWDNIPDAVFIGADTLFKPTLDNEREQGGAV